MNAEEVARVGRKLRRHAGSLLATGGRAPVPMDDLVQSGWVGYLRACQLYRADLGDHEQYTMRGAWAEMLQELRRHGRPRYSYGVRQQRPRLVPMGDGLGPLQEPGPPDTLERARLSQEVERALARLPRRRLLVAGLGLRGATGERIARVLGCSPARVSQIAARARQMLRERMAGG